MSWNYRIVKYRDAGYGLHEVFYNADGTAWSMTNSPISFVANTPIEIEDALHMAINNIKRHGIFVEPEAWADHLA